MKEERFGRAKFTFKGSEVKITKSGQQHLGAAIGSKEFKREYIESMVINWNDQLISLSKIAEMEPQAAYAAFIGGVKSKFSYFLRTIPDIHEYSQPIKDTIANKFIPAISGGHFVNDVEGKLISLPTRYGGLAIPIIKDIAKMEYANSRRITEELALSINTQDLSYNVDTSNIKKKKDKVKCEKELFHKNKLDQILENLNVKQKRLNEMAREKGVSNWLNTYPLKEYGLDLNKQQFWDGISIQYGWPLSNLLTTCACGLKYDFQHSMNCKKGGLVSIHHNDIRDLTANILREVCNDVEVEAKLIPLTGEQLQYR